MEQPIKLGLVGLGRAGTGMHLPELRGRQDKIRFYAVCDLIPERCQPFVDEFGAKAYATYEEMLRDPEIELISVATRSCDHFRHAKMALEAGKDVMLEKPFCCTPEEVNALIALGSQPAGPHLYVRHNRRFEVGFQKICEIIDSGILGNVYEIRMTRNSYQRRCDWQTIREFGGGQLLNWGPHVIDHALRFCGGDYSKLYSEIRHVTAAGNCEDHIKLVFTGVNGRIVDMEISGGVALPTPEFMVYGTRGALINEGENDLYLKYLDPEYNLPAIEADRETPGAGHGFANTEPLHWKEERIPMLYYAGTDRVWDALYESVRHGKVYPIPLDQAAKVTEVIAKVKDGTIFTYHQD